MSGMPITGAARPGSVETLMSCSRLRSWRICSMSSSLANTRASTRMSGRNSFGISQIFRPTGRGSGSRDSGCIFPPPSNVQHDGRLEPPTRVPHREAVEGGGLHRGLEGLRRPPRNPRAKVPLLDLHPLHARVHPAFDLRAVDQLVEPVHEECLEIPPLHLEFHPVHQSDGLRVR